MVQPQIVDYIKSQLKLGVRIGAIKDALLGAGWAEADVGDSLKAADGGLVLRQPKEQVGQANFNPAGNRDLPERQSGLAGGSQRPFVSGGVDPLRNNPAKRDAESQAIRISNGVDISSIFGVKTDAKDTPSPAAARIPNNKPAAVGNVKIGFKPEVGKPVGEKNGAKVPGGTFGKTDKFIFASKSRLGERTGATIILGAVAAVSSLVAVWFYVKGGNIEKELAVLRAGGDLSAKVAELSSRAEALGKEAKSLTGQLLFFARASDVSEAEISDLGGILVGNSGRYLLVTRLGVVITIGNSEDNDVGAALAPRVGQDIKIGGTYVPGSGVITITTLDGEPIKEVAAAE